MHVVLPGQQNYLQGLRQALLHAHQQVHLLYKYLQILLETCLIQSLSLVPSHHLMHPGEWSQQSV